ncbi:NUDIX hydrolase [Micromonospora zhanjiangensis]
MYNVLRYGDGVSVLAVSGDDFYLIREYKYAIGRRIMQLPSGGVDKGEEPLHAAMRELLEETGLIADAWTPLGLVYPYPTNIPSAVHLFVAFSGTASYRRESGNSRRVPGLPAHSSLQRRLTWLRVLTDRAPGTWPRSPPSAASTTTRSAGTSRSLPPVPP